MSAQEMWTIRDILNWTTNRFASLDLPTPLLDAQLLLGSVLHLPKVQLYVQMDRPVSPEERIGMRDLVKRRIAGEPVAYLLNQKDWHTLDLFVDRRVLIPRPETETLLDFVLSRFPKDADPPRAIVDFCTGSGCLAIALAKAFPDSRVLAVDISSDALDVARENAARNHVETVTFLEGDVTSPKLHADVRERLGRADIVVSNPPYVSEDEWRGCDISVRDFEPKLALTAGDDGRAVSRALVANILRAELLGPRGCLGIEMGVGHPERVARACGWVVAGDAFPVHAFNTPAFEFPHGIAFGLRDLSHKERFLCFLAK